ncbi:MAG: RidA family protein [Oligoflexia bacterium]|nr:RidA family protein [Oligoflexia bacterium]
MSKINSSNAPKPVGLYPHARKVGDFLFLSGVGPRQAKTDNIPPGIEEQTKSVFENVRAILEEAGASWNDLIDVTVYLTNMKQDFPAYNKLWAEYFKDNQPCRTTVEVTALPTPISIELKCIAYVSEKK